MIVKPAIANLVFNFTQPSSYNLEGFRVVWYILPSLNSQVVEKFCCTSAASCRWTLNDQHIHESHWFKWGHRWCFARNTAGCSEVAWVGNFFKEVAGDNGSWFVIHSVFEFVFMMNINCTSIRNICCEPATDFTVPGSPCIWTYASISHDSIPWGLLKKVNRSWEVIAWIDSTHYFVFSL